MPILWVNIQRYDQDTCNLRKDHCARIYVRVLLRYNRIVNTNNSSYRLLDSLLNNNASISYLSAN